MDTYTIVNKTALETDLTTIANALRTANGGTSGALTFPTGYVQAAESLASTITGLNSNVSNLQNQVSALTTEKTNLEGGLEQIAAALITACGYADDYEFETYQDYVDAIESLASNS